MPPSTMRAARWQSSNVVLVNSASPMHNAPKSPWSLDHSRHLRDGPANSHHLTTKRHAIGFYYLTLFARNPPHARVTKFSFGSGAAPACNRPSAPPSQLARSGPCIRSPCQRRCSQQNAQRTPIRRIEMLAPQLCIPIPLNMITISK